MKILFDICDNITMLDDHRNRPRDGGDSIGPWSKAHRKEGQRGSYDARWYILKKMLPVLSQNGHTIVLRNAVSDKWHKGKGALRYEDKNSEYYLKNVVILDRRVKWRQEEIIKECDCYVTCSFVNAREDRSNVWVLKMCEKYDVPIHTYDMGWIPDTMWVDRGGLFGSSYFCNIINLEVANLCKRQWNPEIDATEQLQQNPPYVPKDVEEFRLGVLNQEHLTSKRPQPDKQKTQDKIDSMELSGKYIYIPIQKIKDGSITGAGFGFPPMAKFDVLPTLDRIARIALDHKIPIVIKPHPHWQCTHKDLPRIQEKVNAWNGLKETKHFREKKYDFINIVDGNTHTFMSNSMFATSICSASIIDALLTRTPMLYTGKTMFMHSGAIKCDLDIDKGVKMMINQEYDKDKMILDGQRLLWWLNKTSLHMKHTPTENVRRLAIQLGYKKLLPRGVNRHIWEWEVGNQMSNGGR
tara:strand:+ start:5783 stop:7183 length:1401 start_codon:yes stop_codon:yes gene_type:complete